MPLICSVEPTLTWAPVVLNVATIDERALTLVPNGIVAETVACDSSMTAVAPPTLNAVIAFAGLGAM